MPETQNQGCQVCRSFTYGQPDGCNPGDSSNPSTAYSCSTVNHGSVFWMFTWLGRYAQFSNFMYSSDPAGEILYCNGQKIEYSLEKVCCDNGSIRSGTDCGEEEDATTTTGGPCGEAKYTMNYCNLVSTSTSTEEPTTSEEPTTGEPTTNAPDGDGSDGDSGSDGDGGSNGDGDGGSNGDGDSGGDSGSDGDGGDGGSQCSCSGSELWLWTPTGTQDPTGESCYGSWIVTDACSHSTYCEANHGNDWLGEPPSPGDSSCNSAIASYACISKSGQPSFFPCDQPPPI